MLKKILVILSLSSFVIPFGFAEQSGQKVEMVSTGEGTVHNYSPTFTEGDPYKGRPSAKDLKGAPGTQKDCPPGTSDADCKKWERRQTTP